MSGAEQTLNLQLSGTEVIEAVADTVRERMKRDGFLNANSAFDWFSADINIKLDLHDTGAHVKGDYAVTSSTGFDPGPSAEIDRLDIAFQMEPAPPNTVRQDTGQPIPTLTKDAQGKEVIKHVKYARKTGKPALAVLAFALLFSAAVFGQKIATPVKIPQAGKSVPAPAVPSPPVVLTQTETVAFSAIMERIKQVNDDRDRVLTLLRGIVSESEQAHPGYHINLNTLTLEKNVAAK